MREGDGVETETQTLRDASRALCFQDLKRSGEHRWLLKRPRRPRKVQAPFLFLEGLVLLDSDSVSLSSSNTESILCVLLTKLTLAAEVFMVRSA